MSQSPTRFLLSGAGRTFSLARGVYIVGRGSEADIQFDLDRKLSRKHVRLVIEDDYIEVEDLGSANGTWVDDSLVRKKARVTARAQLIVGDTKLTLEPVSSKDWLRATIPEGRFERSVYADEVTTSKHGGGFESLRVAVLGFLAENNVTDARRMLDPILDSLERTRAAPGLEMIDTCSEVALHIALATQSSGYVDTALRIQTQHRATLSDTNLGLLFTCVESRLQPGADTAARYLQLLRQREDSTEQLGMMERLFGANNVA
jgi:hypothetical protein